MTVVWVYLYLPTLYRQPPSSTLSLFQLQRHSWLSCEYTYTCPLHIDIATFVHSVPLLNTQTLMTVVWVYLYLPTLYRQPPSSTLSLFQSQRHSWLSCEYTYTCPLHIDISTFVYSVPLPNTETLMTVVWVYLYLPTTYRHSHLRLLCPSLKHTDTHDCSVSILIPAHYI